MSATGLADLRTYMAENPGAVIEDVARERKAGNGQRGVVRLTVTAGHSGQMLSSRVSGSSGIAVFDAQAMAMIRRAQPFPPFPLELNKTSIPFNIPVEFTVR